VRLVMKDGRQASGAYRRMDEGNRSGSYSLRDSRRRKKWLHGSQVHFEFESCREESSLESHEGTLDFERMSSDQFSKM